MTGTIGKLLGKTLREVTQYGSYAIDFETVDGERWRMEHIQDCCENVSIDDVVGDLQDLVGSPIALAEETSEAPESRCDSCGTWTFYKLATAKGYVTIRWYGESNGYYSESVDFRRVDK